MDCIKDSRILDRAHELEEADPHERRHTSFAQTLSHLVPTRSDIQSAVHDQCSMRCPGRTPSGHAEHGELRCGRRNRAVQ